MSDVIEKVSDTSTLDRMYLEYSNLTGAKTYKELRLEQRIAKLVAERRWIPVTERLPEHDTWVLTWGYWETPEKMHYSQYPYPMWNQKKPTSYRPPITHWMTMPPGPGEGEG